MKTISLVIITALAGSLLSAAAVSHGVVESEKLRTRIIDTAKKHLGARYNYGGIGSKGFDCSGFVQFVYRENGISLPRSTVGQFEKGKKIGLADAKPGDLVFFRIYNGRISHVGILVQGSVFIHAPSTGKCVSFADMNLEYWKKSFAGAVTYIDAK
jgi:cell wall-associated NlpC family hydrolase